MKEIEIIWKINERFVYYPMFGIKSESFVYEEVIRHRL